MHWRSQLKAIIRTLNLMKIAAWGYEIYRLIRKPHTHGALIAIYKNERILLVQTSYRTGYGLPGGGIQPGETAQQAAVREVEEELGLFINEKWLEKPWTITEAKRGGLNTVNIFRLSTAKLDEIKGFALEKRDIPIDDIEIIGTAWMDREEALNEILPSHVKIYLETEYSN